MKLLQRTLLRTILLLASLVLVSVARASAQSQINLQVSPPNIQNFPRVDLRIAVTDGTGLPLARLTANDFEILEDEMPVEDFQVEELLVGTVQTYVINAGPSLRVRDSRGRSRFDFIRSALIDAWQLPEASQTGRDDLTLLTSDGPLVEHSSTIAELSTALDSAEPTFDDQVSGYDLLLSALEYVGTGDPEKSTVSNLIFVTSLLQGPRDIPIPDIAGRARARRTLIFPVLIGAEDMLDTTEADNLRLLAQETGGELIVFDPEIGLSFLTERILNQRSQYMLTYVSQITLPGDHQLQLNLTTDLGEAESSFLDFRLDLSPPDIAFVDPPDEIRRETDDLNLTVDQIPPTRQSIDLLLTFPDGYERPLISSQLVVDEQVIQTRNEPPFDAFEWDLSAYSETGLHTLRAVIVDSFGMEASSVDVPVLVSITRPPGGLAALRPALGSLLTALGVLIAGVILAVALLSRGGKNRLRPSARVNQGVNRVDRIALRRSGPAEAFLIPLQPAGDPIDLTGADLMLGNDASLAAVVIDDPSVDGMHARIIRQADGSYLVRDQGSVAGTWVNFELVPEVGRLLRQGDRIQLGRVEFRFRLPGDAPTREIKVTSEGNESNAA
jgi:hypothetical protein